MHKACFWKVRASEHNDNKTVKHNDTVILRLPILPCQEPTTIPFVACWEPKTSNKFLHLPIQPLRLVPFHHNLRPWNISPSVDELWSLLHMRWKYHSHFSDLSDSDSAICKQTWTFEPRYKRINRIGMNYDPALLRTCFCTQQCAGRFHLHFRIRH